MNSSARSEATEMEMAQAHAGDAADVQSRLNRHRLELDRLNRELEEMRDRYAEARSDQQRAHYRADIERLEGQIAQHGGEYSDIMTEQSRFREQLSGLDARVTSMGATVDGHGVRLNGQDTRIQRLLDLAERQSSIGAQLGVSARAHASAIGTLNSGNGWIALVVGLAASFSTLVFIEWVYKDVFNEKMAGNHEVAWIIGIGVLVGLLANVGLELLQRRDVNQAMATATAQANIQPQQQAAPQPPQPGPNPGQQAPAVQPQPVAAQAQPVLQPDVVIPPPPPPSGQTLYPAQAAAAASASVN